MNTKQSFKNLNDPSIQSRVARKNKKWRERERERERENLLNECSNNKCYVLAFRYIQMPTWREAQQPTQAFKGKSSKPNLFQSINIGGAKNLAIWYH